MFYMYVADVSKSYDDAAEDDMTFLFTLWCYDFLCQEMSLVAKPVCPFQRILQGDHADFLCCCVPVYFTAKAIEYVGHCKFCVLSNMCA